jgi:hypothetical protein
MGVTEVSGLISALAALLAAGFGIYNSRKISDVHVAIDGRLTQLLVTTQQASHAAGVVQGRVEEAVSRNGA